MGPIVRSLAPSGLASCRAIAREVTAPIHAKKRAIRCTEPHVATWLPLVFRSDGFTEAVIDRARSDHVSLDPGEHRVHSFDLSGRAGAAVLLASSHP